MQLLSARLSTVSALLSGISNPQQRALTAKTQAAAMVQLLNRSKPLLEVEDLAALSASVNGIDWCGQECSVLEALVPGQREALHGTRRRSQQHFPALLHFFTAKDWCILQGDSANQEAKKATIIHRMLLLGLRCPKENTLKRMCSLWTFVSCDILGVTTMSYAVQLKQMKASFKLGADALDRTSGGPASYLDAYPGCPAELAGPAPDLLASYGSDSPVACPIESEVVSFDMRFSCRGGGASLADAAPRNTFQMEPFSGGSLNGGFEQMGALMMQGFQQMQHPFHRFSQQV
jgi:hypothetical protein